MWQGFLQIALILIFVTMIAPFFGKYIARVFLGEKTILDPITIPIEQKIYALSRVRAEQQMTGWQYVRAVLYSNFVMGVIVLLIFILQGFLPLNPVNLNAPTWHLALHTVVSFITNTDQQHYVPETTMSYASQVLGLGFLMFTSAATGLAVGIAFIRGLTGRPLGNFYADLTRAITHILLPISVIGALLLLSLGVPETLAAPATFTTLAGFTQTLARGPVAHLEIIKQLGENGGGFFAVNSAHPYENPNIATNIIENIAMLSIPTALIFTYGIFARNKKQSWLLFGMVLIIFMILITVTAFGAYQGNPLVNAIINEQRSNLEGKEIRFGWALTSLWAVSTTATMCGAVNGMHDSLMPTGIFSTLFNMFLQIIWGGQGTGTAYLFIYLIITVFLTGLMVGRTPEFLGRKIEQKEIVLASVILLVHPIAILIPAAITLAFAQSVGYPDIRTLAGITNHGFHGISQVVYEYTSAAANNGSGLEGLIDNNLWWNLTTSFVILMGRYIPITALLLLANSMSNKQTAVLTSGTLRTDSVLFTSVTAGVILILGALTFFPILVLGPIAEGLKIAALNQ